MKGITFYITPLLYICKLKMFLKNVGQVVSVSVQIRTSFSIYFLNYSSVNLYFGPAGNITINNRVHTKQKI